MKQKNTLKRTVCLLLILCSILTGLGIRPMQTHAAASIATIVKQLKASHYKNAARTSKQLPKTANEKCVREMPAKMKKAYRKKVLSYKADNSILSANPYIWDYYLTDFDQDKKAELLIQYGSCEADVQMYVFKYVDGKVKRIAKFSCAHSSFHSYTNGILVYGAHMGMEWVSNYYMKKGELASRQIAEHDAGNGDYLISLPCMLKSHAEYASDYSSRWMNVDDLT